jgi:ABC-type branched-subunit amino acid transport system ATPase component
VFDVVDHIAVLHFGKLVEQGPTADIRRSAKVQEIYLGTG